MHHDKLATPLDLLTVPEDIAVIGTMARMNHQAHMLRDAPATLQRLVACTQRVSRFRGAGRPREHI